MIIDGLASDIKRRRGRRKHPSLTMSYFYRVSNRMIFIERFFFYLRLPQKSLRMGRDNKVVVHRSGYKCKNRKTIILTPQTRKLNFFYFIFISLTFRT